MKTKLIAIIVASVAAASVPATAGPKPNFFCRIPVLRSTTLCNTYNLQMAQRLAPQVPTYNVPAYTVPIYNVPSYRAYRR